MSDIVLMPLHRVVREVLRSYTSLKQATPDEWEQTICRVIGCVNTRSVRHRIQEDYGSERQIEAAKGHDGACYLISISLMDLQGCLKDLSPRKREAVFYHIILDWKQKDVAARMGITTVSVGQYVEQGMLQIAKKLWPQEYEQETE